MGTLELMQAMLPACITFGPLFLVMPGKDDKRTRTLRYIGAIVVGIALMIMWFVTNSQKHQISLLQQRLEHLEARGH